MYKVLIAAILLLAMNLRVPLLAVTPLLQFIRQDFGFANSIAGLLTALPLIIFALLSSFMAGWSQKYGVGKVIVISIATIIGGELLRYLGGMYGLFVGTIIIAIGIVAGNVLIPALIRGFFPNKMGIMTSCYSAIMQVSTTIALVTAVPISYRIGWSNTLVSLVFLAILALVCWIPFSDLTFESAKTGHKLLPKIVEVTRTTSSKKMVSMKTLYKQPLAWDVSFFMGIQSLLFYSVSTWLPSVIISKHLSPVMGGYMGFLFQLVSLIATFILPLLLSYLAEQKWAAVVSCLSYGVGIAGLFLFNDEVLLNLFVGLAGIGAGATFAIALMYFVMRTQSAAASAILSGTGQAIGYVLASIGPVIIGYLYDFQQSWNGTIIFLLFFCTLFGITGYRAGRNRKLNE